MLENDKKRFTRSSSSPETRMSGTSEGPIIDLLLYHWTSMLSSGNDALEEEWNCIYMASKIAVIPCPPRDERPQQ
ncbi:MAG: hypothetical protein ACXVDN_21545 [Ktedonobacteraceae bacterium]